MKMLKKIKKFNSSRYRLKEVNQEFAKNVPSGARVLDAGAGRAPYRELFSHANYESADFEQVDKQYAPSNYVCDLKEIPVGDNYFDYIIFNQVMEHLPEPEAVLKEFQRILKPGGKIIYTGPLFYEEHEQPYDFYRYTQFGLKHLFTKSGFEIEYIDWLEGYYGTLGYQLNRMAHCLSLKPKDLGGGIAGVALVPVVLMFKIMARLGSIIFHRLEIKTKFKRRGYPKNYHAILAKP